MHLATAGDMLSAALAVPAGGGGSHSGGSKNPVWLLVVGLVFIVIAGTQAVNPRLLWRMNRWAYKHPEAHEPSEKGFMAQRVIGGVVTIVGVVLVVVAITKF